MRLNAIDLVIVVVCIVADVVTGLVSAWLSGTFASAKMREGAGHKLGELFAMGMCYGVQWALPMVGVETSINIVRGFAIYIVIMEFASVSENIINMDPELKGPLGNLAKTLKEVLHTRE